MVHYRRSLVPGGTFFFTVAAADRRSSILVDNIVSLRRAFRITRGERPFTIDAVVILPDHLHIIMTLPEEDADFSGRWRRIKSLFSRYVVSRGLPVERNRRGEYALWQSRFWEHAIRNEMDLDRHVDYIHYNPVKHGLISRVSHWPFSSFHRYVRQGWLPQDWAGLIEEPDAAGFGERGDEFR
ncbi:MAG TPA: transposase [Xanthobacteraceae bacterium]|nr:transposase [Xanthobacteraceae bacterium]